MALRALGFEPKKEELKKLVFLDLKQQGGSKQGLMHCVFDLFQSTPLATPGLPNSFASLFWFSEGDGEDRIEWSKGWAKGDGDGLRCWVRWPDGCKPTIC